MAVAPRRGASGAGSWHERATMGDSEIDVPAGEPQRQPYTTPRLGVFGSLADLTQGAKTMTMADSGGAMASNRSA